MLLLRKPILVNRTISKAKSPLSFHPAHLVKRLCEIKQCPPKTTSATEPPTSNILKNVLRSRPIHYVLRISAKTV